MDGARELIDDFATAGFALAVGSSGPPENVQLILEKLQRGSSFQAVVTGMDVTRGKPDPQVFSLCAERLGLAPAKCLVIEDAAVGVAAAQAAGCRCIGLANRGQDASLLGAADLVIHRLRELSAQGIASLVGDLTGR
jgi:beta-phosphoglucomutase